MIDEQTLNKIIDRIVETFEEKVWKTCLPGADSCERKAKIYEHPQKFLNELMGFAEYLFLQSIGDPKRDRLLAYNVHKFLGKRRERKSSPMRNWSLYILEYRLSEMLGREKLPEHKKDRKFRLKKAWIKS